MLQTGGEADLAPEARGAERLSNVRGEHLERDPPVVLAVVGAVDRGHAAAADLCLDHVRVAERLLEAPRNVLGPGRRVRARAVHALHSGVWGVDAPRYEVATRVRQERRSTRRRLGTGGSPR